MNVLVSRRVGGAEKIALDIHRHAAHTFGDQAELLVPDGGDTARLASEEGLNWRPYPFEALLDGRTSAALMANVRLVRPLALRRPGVVHVHSPFVYAAMRPVLAVSGHKRILHLQIEYDDAVLRWALRLPPHVVIVCASFMTRRVEAILGHHIAAGHTRIVVVRNAVDLGRFNALDRGKARAELGLPASTPVLLMLANLAPHKGQETSIRALAELRRAGQPAHLLLAGEEREEGGRFTQRLRSLAVSLGVDDRVRFLGPRSDVPRLLAAADALLLPSTHEGLPLCVLEAQAAGVLVLAAPTAGVPEVVRHGRTGFLLQANDPAAYALTLSRVLAKPAAFEPMRRAARAQIVHSHGAQRFLAAVETEYRNLGVREA